MPCLGGVLTMIYYAEYSDENSDLEIAEGFFAGWPDPPSQAIQRNILKNSYCSLIAIDSGYNRIVGFITATSDGILSAYIPLLEVVPQYQGQGIGSELVRQMLQRLDGFYMIDLTCDAALQPFYERFGLMKSQGMALRNFDNQSGCVKYTRSSHEQGER
jgi:ribosomal protein S18 acetylase RimI-like enzyme